MAYTVTYVAVTWTSGDTITETKMDNMVSNDQCYDAFAAEGMMLNNNIGYSQKEAGGTRRVTDIVDASDIQSLGNTNLTEVALLTRAKARAYKSSAVQAVGTGSATQITLDVESYDVGGDFASNAFTTPVAGYYLINASLQVDAVDDQKYASCLIYVNGSSVKRTNTYASGASNISVAATTIQKVAAALDITLYCIHNHGSNRNVSNNSQWTFLEVHLLSMGD